MYKLHSVALVLGLSSVALAQPSAPFTTPDGYLTTEGMQLGGGTSGGFAYYFGYYPNARFQMVDGELKGKGVKIISSVGYRLDYRNHTTSTATGRQWTNVTLSVSDCDFDKVTTSWAGNATSTPTTVYSAATSWPSQTGNPTTSPASWDAQLAFPFTSTYAYTGASDLLLDYTFSGGTMANAAAWGTSSTGSSPAYTYYLDGFYWTTAVTFGRNVYRTNSNTCNDGAWSHTTYASSAVQVGLYGPTSTQYPDTAQLQIFGNATAPNALILKAFSLAGLTPLGVGVDIGANCNWLMIDMTNAVVLPFTTDANGNHNPWTYVKLGSLKQAQTFGSLQIWCQGAWADSVTGNFSLTSCERCAPTWNYPILSDPKVLPRKKAVYRYDNTNSVGFGPYDYYYMNPITRFN